MDGDEGLSLLFKDLGETATENEYNLRLIREDAVQRIAEHDA